MPTTETEAPTLTPGARVQVRVDRQFRGDTFFPGGWYVGVVEEIRVNPEAERLPYVWQWCYAVRTRKGDVLFSHCDPSCVRAA